MLNKYNKLLRNNKMILKIHFKFKFDVIKCFLFVFEDLKF